MKSWTWQTADRNFRAAMLKRWEPHPAFSGIRCAGCEKVFPIHHIDVAHWISRRVKALRWWPTNVLPLCRSCHRKAHEDPWHHPMRLWMTQTFGIYFDVKLQERQFEFIKERQAIKELMTWAG